MGLTGIGPHRHFYLLTQRRQRGVAITPVLLRFTKFTFINAEVFIIRRGFGHV